MKILNFAPKLEPDLLYSHILRGIGQKLEQLELKAFEIKCQDDIYLVQAWHKGTSISVDVKRRYTLDELQQLEIEMRTKRRPGSSRANPLKLSQLLRTAGNYVDNLGGQLLRVEWQCQSDKVQCLTLQYEASEAEREETGGARGTIEEICVHIYKEKKKVRPIPARPIPLETLS